MHIKHPVQLSLALFALVVTTSKMYGDTMPTQVTSASGLSGNDITLGIVSAAQPVGYVSPGNSISFITGDQLVFSRASGQFEVDEAGVTYGGTAFHNNTNLVGAGGFQGPGDGGPITLNFTIPVIQFGLNIEDFNSGLYTVDFTAYDASGHVILSNLTASGNDPSTGGTGTLSFEGVTAAQDPLTGIYADPISRVVFDDSAAGGSNNLLFGNIEFAPVGSTLQAPPPAVTPEPSSLALLGTGLASLVCLGRRAKSKLSNNLTR